jgi:hypothetical protein
LAITRLPQSCFARTGAPSHAAVHTIVSAIRGLYFDFNVPHKGLRRQAMPQLPRRTFLAAAAAAAEVAPYMPASSGSELRAGPGWQKLRQDAKIGIEQ